MIRQIFIVAAAVLLLLSFAACGKNDEDISPSDSSSTVMSEKTVMGEVTGIDGQTITLAVFAMPSGALPSGALPDDGSQTGSPQPPSGQNPEGQEPPAGGPPADNGSFPGITASGETITVTAGPDTVVTVKSDDGTKTGTLSDISVGDVISVTVSDSEAVAITVMNAAPDAGMQAGA